MFIEHTIVLEFNFGGEGFLAPFVWSSIIFYILNAKIYLVKAESNNPKSHFNLEFLYKSEYADVKLQEDKHPKIVPNAYKTS